MLVGGAVAVVLVAALVVSMTPRSDTSGPIAVSATTTPAATQSIKAAADSAVAAAASIRSARLTTFAPIPAAIADVPAAAFGSGLATDTSRVVLPDLDDEVLVLTESYAYSVAWRDAARLDVEDGIVIARDGELVARFTEGRLVVSHDLLIGAALSVD